MAGHIRDFYREQVILEHAVTRALIAMVPSAHLELPDPFGRRSVADLIWLLVQYQLESLRAICGGPAADGEELSPKPSVEAALAWDDEHFPQAVERLEALSEEELLLPLSMDTEEFPAVALLPIYLTAQVTTRAQLSVALAQAGVARRRADLELGNALLAVLPTAGICSAVGSSAGAALFGGIDLKLSLVRRART